MDLPESLAANLPAFDWSPRTRSRYEVWYGKVVRVDPSRPSALWFRYLIETHGDARPPEAACWGSWFEQAPGAPFVLTRTFPLPELPRSTLAVELSPGHAFGYDPATGRYRARGSLEDKGNVLVWDLTWSSPGPAFRYVASDVLRRMISSSGASTPCPDVRVDGTVTVSTRAGGTRTFTLTRAHGQQGHIFGTKKPWAWAWAHGNRWVDAVTGAPVEAGFEAIHVIRQRGGRPLTAAWLRLEGHDWFMNGLRDLLPHRGAVLFGPRRGLWARAGHDDLSVEHYDRPALAAHFSLVPGLVAAVEYQDTDGSILVNRNGSAARAELTLDLGPGGRRRLVSECDATLELVTRREGS